MDIHEVRQMLRYKTIYEIPLRVHSAEPSGSCCGAERQRGGALATGRGGIAADEAFLALSGPKGWAIAGVALLTSGFFIWKSQVDKNILKYLHISVGPASLKAA